MPIDESPRSSSFLQLPPATRLALLEREESKRGAERARGSLLEFTKRAWPIIEPGTPFVPNWHIDAKCDHLEAVTRGEITRLLINEPPGHLKSIIVSVMWPAWVWVTRPEWRAIFGSYAQTLANRDSMKCRDVITSDWYRVHFSDPGRWTIADDQNTKALFANTRRGFRQATSVGGGATGHRGNAVVFDDALNLLDAYSKAARDEANTWVDKAMSNRLNDLRTDVIVMVAQRLHEEDPCGHVLRQGGYEHLCLPSEFDPRHRAVTYHVVPVQPSANVQNPTAPTVERREFWRDPREQAGELLFEARFPAEVLARERARLLEDGYAGQHQQRPMPPGGGMFKVKDWRFWKPDGVSAEDQAPRDPEWYQGPARPCPARDVFDKILISVDATFKETDDGSFVAMHVWGGIGGDRFLLERVHDRMDFEDSVKALRGLIRRWPEARTKVIEGAANGDATRSTLEKRYRIAGIVMEPTSRGNKETRARAMLPYQRSGNVYLPDGAPWLGEYIGEHGLFPKGATNDDVDCQSQALRHLEAEQTDAEKWAAYAEQQRREEAGEEPPPEDEDEF